MGQTSSLVRQIPPTSLEDELPIADARMPALAEGGDLKHVGHECSKIKNPDPTAAAQQSQDVYSGSNLTQIGYKPLDDDPQILAKCEIDRPVDPQSELEAHSQALERMDALETSSAAGNGELDSQDDLEDRSLVTYARKHGISVNYLSEHPLDPANLPIPSEYPYSDILDPAGVPSVETLVILGALSGTTTKERWDVDRGTVDYLSTVMALSQEPSGEDTETKPRLKAIELKVEQPILRTDMEMDMLRLSRRNEIRLSADGMEPFELDCEQGEGLEWPTSLLALPAAKDREVESERLEVNRETAEFLKVCMQDPQPETDAAEMAQQDYERHKANATWLLTPPLLPLSPLHSPRAAPAPGNFEYTSVPRDSSLDELGELDNEIMAKDALMDAEDQSGQAVAGQRADVGEMSSLTKAVAGPSLSSSPRAKRKHIGDMEVDTTLTPPNHRDSLPKRTKSGSLPEHPRSNVPAAESRFIEDPAAYESDHANAILREAAPIAEPAMRQIQTETAVEANTTLKAPVQDVDQTLPMPPWKLHAGRQATMSMLKNEVLKDESRWRGVDKLDRMLGWSTFPASLGKVETTEDFDDGSLASYVAELSFGDAPDMDSLVWKPDSLRVLHRQDDDYEELEPAELRESECEPMLEAGPILYPAKTPFNRVQQAGPPVAPEGHSSRVDTVDPPFQKRTRISASITPPTTHSRGLVRLDMATLLRKRQLDFEASDRDLKVVAKKQAIERPKAFKCSRSTESPSSTAVGYQVPGIEDNHDMLDGFTAGTSLASFMQLHTGAVPTKPDPKRQAKLAVTQEAAPTAVMVAPPQHLTEQAPPQLPPMPLPLPQIPSISSPPQVIVSSTMLKQCNLIRQIQSTIPNLELVERDLTRRRSQDNKSDIPIEADITIFPGRGIIVTNLQKLKQKPLPGHTSYSSIRDRIAATAPQYEWLQVLVSAASLAGGGAQALDDKDCSALSDLIGFTSALDTDIQVTYVPGGESDVAMWIAASIARYAGSPGTELLPEETLWEQFLRRAGLNAFAAQTVLARLKAPEQVTVHSSSPGLQDPETSSFGLAAFIQMSAEARIARFGALLGGDRVLRRVSAVIDAGWIAIANSRSV